MISGLLETHCHNLSIYYWRWVVQVDSKSDRKLGGHRKDITVNYLHCNWYPNMLPWIFYLTVFKWTEVHLVTTLSPLSITSLYLLRSSSHTVCWSPWPVTWAMTSHRLHTPQWTSTCQHLQLCSLRNTDETYPHVLRKYINHLWWHMIWNICMCSCYNAMFSNNKNVQ